MSSAGGGEDDKKPGDQLVHINLKVKGQVIFFFSFSAIDFDLFRKRDH